MSFFPAFFFVPLLHTVLFFFHPSKVGSVLKKKRSAISWMCIDSFISNKFFARFNFLCLLFFAPVARMPSNLGGKIRRHFNHEPKKRASLSLRKWVLRRFLVKLKSKLFYEGISLPFFFLYLSVIISSPFVLQVMDIVFLPTVECAGVFLEL